MTELAEHTCWQNPKKHFAIGGEPYADCDITQLGVCPACAQARLWREKIRPALKIVADELKRGGEGKIPLSLPIDRLNFVINQLDQRYKEVKDE